MIKNYKLGLGPMSPFITESIIAYADSNQYPIMLIASRNQIDYDNGYAMSTREFSVRFGAEKSDNILFCRDHCGPYFLDSEKSLPESAAIEATKKTIAADIEHGFDLIHIDTSRAADTYKTAETLIEFAVELKPNIMFEFGTEENIGVAAGVEKYKQDVDFAKQFPGMQFVVAQTGSLVMENRQVGTFESDTVADLVAYASAAGLKLKEHNADYLTAEQIALRRQAGVHAVNVAPQLGVLQTTIFKTLCEEKDFIEDWQKFRNAVLTSGKWRKWHIDCDDDVKTLIAGHYLWKDYDFQIALSKINAHDFLARLNSSVAEVIDLYKDNL